MRLFWPGLIYKRDTFVSARSRLIGKKNIRLGENVVVLSSAVLNCNRSRFIPLKPLQIAGHITIGDYTLIAEYAMLITYSGYITLGSRCSVNPFTMLYGTGGLEIGNNVHIGAHCTIVASNHIFKRVDIPISDQGSSGKGIKIDDDVWIGAGVRILDGAYIGKGAVVGAGAVVRGKVEPYTIVGGVPARQIGVRAGNGSEMIEAEAEE